MNVELGKLKKADSHELALQKYHYETIKQVPLLVSIMKYLKCRILSVGIVFGSFSVIIGRDVLVFGDVFEDATAGCYAQGVA